MTNARPSATPEELAEEIELIVLDSATGFYRLERAGDTEGGESPGRSQSR